MAKPLIFIDGQEGTTGLRIRQMLEPRDDVEVLLIPSDKRKDPTVRAEYFKRADLAVLCLPDQAADEALELVGQTRLIDTSTPRRVADDWVYGLPEISPQQRQAISTADRVANCGCYPVGFILAVRPLIEAGLLDPATPLTLNSVSGYSGGGRSMIEAYRAAPNASDNDAPIPLSLYGLEGDHKHLAEMKKFSLSDYPPLFVPSVDHTYCGMLDSVPVPAAFFKQGATGRDEVYQVWANYYRDSPFVRPIPPSADGEMLAGGKYLPMDGCNFTNKVELFVFGDGARGLVLVGRLDNLGKGAAGNAVQCLNLMLGFDERTGLEA